MKRKRTILTKTLPFLQIVSQLKPDSRRKILRELNGHTDIYKSMREIAINTVKGNVKLIPNILKRLQPHMPNLKRLCKHKTTKCSCKKRSALIQQGSGALPFLIPAIAQIVSTLISRSNNE